MSMEKERIAIYQPSNNGPEEYLNLEHSEGLACCEQIRESQGFKKITTLAPFYSHSENKALEIWVYQKAEKRIIEIWDWCACVCIFATRTERDFFDLLCKFSELKKNIISFEQIEKTLDSEQE